MKKPLHFVYSLLVLGFLGYVATSFLNCSSGKGTSELSEQNFLGDQSCGSCHQKEYDDWLGSHHDLAMQEANSNTVLGNFDDARFESNGVKSNFFKKDGKYFVHTEGPTGSYEDFEVLYTFGVEPLQQYLIALPGGRLQCLLTAWDSEAKKWYDLMPENRLQPDDWLHWTKGSMTWNTMCADCHSTNLKKNFKEADNSFDTEYSIIDVSCEACHGPGEQHVDYIESGEYKNGEKIKGSHLHLTAGIENKQQVEECGRCHARRGPQSNVFQHGDAFMDHYVSEILRPGLYHGDGQILDEVYVYGSFIQSKMYRNGVQCSHCHEPHSLKLRFEGNQLCTQCHIPKDFDSVEHHFHQEGTAGADCKNCHMTGKTYMGNDFRRDHSFRIPRPDQSVEYGTPNACNNCHEDQSDEWAANAIENWYGPNRKFHFSDALLPVHNGSLEALPDLARIIGDTSIAEIAQATGLWLMGSIPAPESNQKILEALKNEHPIIRHAAVSAMERFSVEDRLRYLSPLLQDTIKAIRANTAYIMADVSEKLMSEQKRLAFQKAIKEYEEVLAVQADFPNGQLMKGQFYEKKSQPALAEKAYRASILQDPYLPTPHFNLANLYYRQNKLDSAEIQFKKVIELQADAADVYYSLGLLQVERKKLEEAAANLQQAAELGNSPRYYYNWGLCLQYLNKPAEAEQVYQKALELFPDSPDNSYALAILYLQQQRNSEARRLINFLVKNYPNNPNYQQLLQNLNPG